MCFLCYRELGSPSDNRSNICHAELGDGVQEMVSGVQNPDLLRQPEGKEAEADGVDQGQHIPRLHHVLQARGSGPPELPAEEVEIPDS